MFTSTTSGRPRGFVGWATPSELLRRLLAREPKLRDAYHAAQQDLLLHQLATPMELGGPPMMLSWTGSAKMEESWPVADPLPALAERKAGTTGKIEYPLSLSGPGQAALCVAGGRVQDRACAVESGGPTRS